MAYSITYADTVKTRIRNAPGISRSLRVRLFTAINSYLREITEEQIAERMVASGQTEVFVWDWVAMSEGRLHRFALAVDGSKRKYGVLDVIGLQHFVNPPQSPPTQ